MARQNRVNPFGAIEAVPDLGKIMGNRGCLHDAHGRVRRSWQVERWIVCLLEFKDRHRRVMTPGHYTELFFLDEATALSAGHRPCAECRRERFNDFRRALASRGPVDHGVLLSAIEIDHQLHADRLNADGSQRTHLANLDHVPDGALVLVPGGEWIPYLVSGDALLRWSFGGYLDRLDRPHGIDVAVLTPELTFRALRGGYVPELHPSAQVLLGSPELSGPAGSGC